MGNSTDMIRRGHVRINSILLVIAAIASIETSAVESPTPLEILRKAFDDMGVVFYERTEEGYIYVLLGEDKNQSFAELQSEHFFEFESDGSIASY